MEIRINGDRATISFNEIDEEGQVEIGIHFEYEDYYNTVDFEELEKAIKFLKG